jgi:hypothetical protein
LIVPFFWEARISQKAVFRINRQEKQKEQSVPESLEFSEQRGCGGINAMSQAVPRIYG